MNDAALQRQIKALDQEVKLLGEYYEKKLIDLRSEVDRLKLESAALKVLLQEALPSFSGRFEDILEKTIREVNPESEGEPV